MPEQLKDFVNTAELQLSDSARNRKALTNIRREILGEKFFGTISDFLSKVHATKPIQPLNQQANMKYRVITRGKWFVGQNSEVYW